MHLVLIETSGNQNYIFATNKLRENVGASELIYRVGTRLVLSAIAHLNQNYPKSAQLWTNDSASLRKKLLDPVLNPKIEDHPSIQAEVIIATSGKALILVRDREAGQAIIQAVTRQALRLAPGLDVCGVISDQFDWFDRNFAQFGLAAMNRQVHQRLALVRSRRPSPATRFLRLPIVADCATSSYPAAQVESFKGEPVLRSQVSISKRRAASSGIDRIQALLRRHKPGVNLLESIQGFDQELRQSDSAANGQSRDRAVDWLAVVHADGNGLGEVFLKFGQYVQNNRDYVTQYREFSIALDICTEKSFLDALNTFMPPDATTARLPVVPLILGGDDLTLVCDGAYALKFTHRFLQAFEQLSQTPIAPEDAPLAHPKILTKIANQAFQCDRFSACAGVAIVKPHFPFSTAYRLAEDLIQSAKLVKTKIVQAENQTRSIPCSAIDFHILYDSSGGDLKEIRRKLLQDTQEPDITQLWGRPYLVTPLESLKTASDRTWIHYHHWQQLEAKVAVLLAENQNGKRQLPNSQIHDLREGLFLGRKAADARYQLIRDRYCFLVSNSTTGSKPTKQTTEQITEQTTDSSRSASATRLAPVSQGICILEANAELKTLFWTETQDSQITYRTALLDAMDAASFWEGHA